MSENEGKMARRKARVMEIETEREKESLTAREQARQKHTEQQRDQAR